MTKLKNQIRSAATVLTMVTLPFVSAGAAYAQGQSSAQAPKAQQVQLSGRPQGNATATIQQSGTGSTSSSVNTVNPTVQVQGNYAGSIDAQLPGNVPVNLNFAQAIEMGLRYNLGGVLPKADAFQAEQLFGHPPLTSLAVHPDTTCEAPLPAKLNALHVELPVVEGIIVPAEYRALLYEQIITKLREENTFSTVYRDGDVALASACPDYKLVLTIKAFSKGDAALRASTGPVGFFVGTTSFRVHVSVQSRSGSRLIDKEMKVSQRGDSESLNVADKIGKSLNKELKKRLKSQHDLISDGD